jgi:hypothetical protein
MPQLTITWGGAQPETIAGLSPTVINLLAGFVLTTVIGTFLTGLVQQRAWAHQWKAQKAAEELRQAQDTYLEISRLLDRRLYWLTQFLTWLSRADAERLRTSLSHYRRAVRDWNETINRNLAMLQVFFGEPYRNELDIGVGAAFVAAGKRAEHLYQTRTALDREDYDRSLTEVETLRLAVYSFNLTLLERTRELQEEGRPIGKSWHSILLGKYSRPS